MVHVALIAGEESGDQLGARLMAAMREEEPGVTFSGVGGRHMAKEGLRSLFPLDEIAVMGPLAILARLRPLLKRMREAADDVIARRPDVLVIIDSPEFTHRVARRVRKALPSLPIVNYSPPTVWAWRPRRAEAMREYVDRSLALLPFEPAAHQRLGGPPCYYVGHPMLETSKEFLEKPSVPQEGWEPLLLVLPGSRRSELAQLLVPFRDAVEMARAKGHRFRVAVPVVHHLRAELRERLAAWPVPVQLIEGEAAKWAAFRRARGALVASGTATLQLALADVPMVVGYRVEPSVAWLAPAFRKLFPMRSVVMPNLVLDENVIPEFIQEPCTAENLAAALGEILADGEARQRQLEAFAEIRRRVMIEGTPPSRRAASLALASARPRSAAEMAVAAPEEVRGEARGEALSAAAFEGMDDSASAPPEGPQPAAPEVRRPIADGGSPAPEPRIPEPRVPEARIPEAGISGPMAPEPEPEAEPALAAPPLRADRPRG